MENGRNADGLQKSNSLLVIFLIREITGDYDRISIIEVQ